MAVFYIDPSTGNNANSGLSPTQAWAGFVNITAARMIPGNQFLLRGGQVFTEVIAITTKGGGPRRQLLFGSFGTGRAILNGTGAAVGGTAITLTGASYIVFQDLEIRNYQIAIGTTGPVGSTSVSVRRCSLHDLTSAISSLSYLDTDWYVADNVVNQCSANGLTLSERSQIVRNDVGNCGTVTGSSAAVSLLGSNHTVRDNELHHCTNTGSGILVRGQSNLISRNIIHDCTNGVFHSPLSASGDQTITRIRYNRSYAISAHAVSLNEVPTGGTTGEIFVLANNTLHLGSSTRGVVWRNAPGGLILVNNIIGGPNTLTNLLLVEGLPSLGFSETYNQWWQNTGTPSWNVNGTNRTTFNSYLNAGFGQSSRFADPLISSAPGLVPGATSTALNAGTISIKVGSQTDIWIEAGDNAPMHYSGSAPDLGAVQLPDAPTAPDDLDFLPKNWEDDPFPSTGLPPTPLNSAALEDMEVRSAQTSRRERDRLQQSIARRIPVAPVEPVPPRDPYFTEIPGEIQTITSTLGSGNFTMTYRGQTTAGTTFSASAATVQSRLEALSTIGTGNVSVSGPNSGPWAVTFQNLLAGDAAPTITTNSVNVTVTTTRPVTIVTDGGGLTAALNAATVASIFVLADGIYDSTSYWTIGSLPHKFYSQRSLENTILQAGFFVGSNSTLDSVEFHGLTFNVTTPTNKTFAGEAIHIWGTGTKNVLVEDCVFDGGSGYLMSGAVRCVAPERVRIRRCSATRFNSFGFLVSDNSDSPRQMITPAAGATSSGIFTLQYAGATTANQTYSATLSAATLQTALTGLSTIGSGNAVVSGSNGGPWLVTFQGTLAGQDVELIKVNWTNMTATATTKVFAVDWSPTRSVLEDLDVKGIFGISGNTAQTLGGDGPGNPGGTDGTGEVGIWLGNTVTMSRCRITDCGWAGIVLVSSSRDTVISDVRVQNCNQAGIQIRNTTYDLILQRFQAVGKQLYGIYAEPWANSPLRGERRIVIRDGYSNARRYGIFLDAGVSDTLIENVTLVGGSHLFAQEVQGRYTGAGGIALRSALNTEIRFCDFTQLVPDGYAITEVDTGDSNFPACAGNSSRQIGIGSARLLATSGAFQLD